MTTLVATMIAPNAVSRTISAGVEVRVEAGAQLVLDGVRVGREQAAEVDDQLVELVEREPVGVLAVVDQDAAEEGRADQAVVLDADRVAEQVRPALAEDRHDAVVERIPLEQRVERGGAVRERPLHVRHAPARGGVGVGGGARRPRARAASSSGGIQGMAGIMPSARRRPAWRATSGTPGR